MCVCLQCLWRCHAAEHRSKFRATWRIHEQDSILTGHHSSHHIAKSLGRLARRTTGSISSTTRKPWPRQTSRGSLMDASHAAVAGSMELSSHAGAGAAGDTFDADDQTSPAAGVIRCTFFHLWYIYGLRSAKHHQLMIPRHRRSTFGRRAFSVAGPMKWNLLPHSLCDPARSTDDFRSVLKIHLFLRRKGMISALEARHRDALYKSTTTTTTYIPPGV